MVSSDLHCTANNQCITTRETEGRYCQILESGLEKAKLDSSTTFKLIFYSHGQKSWDTFAFPGHFPIHTCPTRSLIPQTRLDVCIQNFFQVSTLYGLEEGQMKKILKRLHCFMREPRYCRKLRIRHYCPKDFCPGLQVL